MNEDEITYVLANYFNEEHVPVGETAKSLMAEEFRRNPDYEHELRELVRAAIADAGYPWDVAWRRFADQEPLSLEEGRQWAIDRIWRELFE